MLELIAYSCLLASLSVITLVGFELWEMAYPKPKPLPPDPAGAKPTGIESWFPLTLIDPDAFVDKLRHHQIKTKPRKKSKKTKKR